MTIEQISQNPYFDDFNEENNFHQILFKPGYAVQARELTQLQSILRNQIARFGSHIFKHGSVVIPGNANAELNTPYVKVESTYLGTPITLSSFVGQTVVCASTGVEAVVKHVEVAANGDPNLMYLVYTKGSGTTAPNTFLESNTLQISGGGAHATVVAADAIGSGSLVHINKGIFFINGSFVYVGEQTITLSKMATNPSCHVMLKIVESIVDSDQDESLLDPANGSTNYAAPGADRLKIDLVLTKIALDATVTDDYVELMRFNEGVMEINNRYAQYNELEKSLARRTYDESGDYRVSGFDISLRDHLKTAYNNGLTTDGDRAKFVAEFSQGKAYLKGFELEKLGASRLVLDKGRTSDHVKVKSLTIQNNYGKYLYVTDLVKLPNFYVHDTVTFYNISATTGGTAVGTASVIGLDYHVGDPTTTNAIYRLFFHDLVLNPGYTMADIGGFRGGVNSATGTIVQRHNVPNATLDFTVAEVVSTVGSAALATVKNYSRATGDLYLYKHSVTDTPVVGEIITGATSTAVATIRSIEQAAAVGALPIFNIAVDSLKAVKNASNAYDTAYSVIKTFSITTGSTLVLGKYVGSYTASGGTFPTPEAGITVISGPAGVVDVINASISSGVTFNLGTASASTTYWITTMFNKTAGQPKTKAKVVSTLTGVTPAYTIALGKADVYRVTSVIDGSGNDWTSRYILDNGQTDYYYGVGSILLNSAVLPSSNLSITFEYFTHSAGDYFDVDSYTSLGVDYLNQIPTYTSKTTNKDYNLRNCMDYRSRIGESTSYTETVVPGSATVTSVQYYVPRVDAIFLNSNGTIDAVRGEPADKPKASQVPANSLKLFNLFVPAYTDSIDDIIVAKEKNIRFTMKDISNLKDRIENIEYFSTLSATENSLFGFEVVDAVTGLNRFKTGYLVDNFSNPFTVCDYYNPLSGTQFRALELSPTIEYHDSAFIVEAGASSNYQITGNQITLPYTEVPFIKQDTSTRVTNINHFLMISWAGVMTIDPPIDNWIDTEYLPQIYNVVNNTVTVTREDHVTIWDPAPLEVQQTPIPATVNIGLNNSLFASGLTGQTVFAAPLSAVHQIAPGIWVPNANITANEIVAWGIDQFNSGLTHQRVAGENVGIAALTG